MQRHIKLTALGAVALLALAGCSSHGSSSPQSSAGTSSTGASSSSSSTAAAGGAGSFGTLGTVCGPGSATGSTDTGVTDTTIQVGTIADVGWATAPGLLQPIFDGADAFVGWCNAAGGINGRKLKLDKRDSAFSNYLPQVKTSCTSDVALVGSMGILDDTGVDAWQACGLLNFTAATVGAKAANAKLMYPMTPIPADQQTIGGFHLFFDQHPDWASAVGSLYSNGAAGDREQHTYNEAITNIGGKIVYTAEYTPTTSNWTPYVQAMKKAGVKFLFLNDTANVTAGIEQAMATLNWYPELQISPSQLYDETTLQLAGKTIKNYYTYIPTTPFEAAAQVPAVQQYLNLLTQYAPKAKKTFFGATAFSAWLLFAEGVKSCGSNVTRKCISDYVATQKQWTGGGLQGPIDPASNKASQCFILMKVESNKFTQAFPSQLGQYDCSAKNAPTVKP
ncbi:MAG: ABC-type branched-chain amino acid transport system, periplasmic component [Pseudonocardiales bacterium]|nr:ABC-type branched-chain amino acid transport system, periplasmic component [Pseudonocardiales bacterium]